MNKSPKGLILLLLMGIAALLVAAVQSPPPDFDLTSVPPAQLTPTVTASQDERPFRLPFREPAGSQTWLMAQPYGNTTGAYFQRYTTYGASGGIHFGIDLAAPCGTEIVAIADGIVFAVDGPFGSAPHNLMIDHPQLGYASMYGHLLEAPSLRPGQFVEAGQVVALVGDSRGDCNVSPHLHLEIRDLKHFRKFNPVNLIEADWDKLALYGSSGRGFVRDLDEPRKWQDLYDQPEVQTGGPIVNDFERTWPMDWDQPVAQARSNPTPTATPKVETGSARAEPVITPPPQIPALLPASSSQLQSAVRQITSGDCCTNPFWNAESTEVRFIDRPSASEPLGVWALDVTRPKATPQLVLDRLGVYNEDRSLIAYPDRQLGLAVVERLADGQRWEIDTQGSRLSFTPNGQVLWTVYDSEVSWRARQGEIWLADPDGTGAELMTSIQRGGPAAWLSDDELLLTSRVPPSQDTLLSKLSIADGTITELIQLPRIRSGALSPDKRYLVYFVRFNADSDKNGLWLLDLEARQLEPERLPFFGAYRWRDDQHLIYIPFDLEASEHIFYEYNVRTGRSRQLFPKDGQPFDVQITNNDWDVSPDGNKIALVAAKDGALDGIWVIELE